MTVYLDTSVVVSLFANDAHSARARQITSASTILAVSDLTAAEFSSALSIHYRTGRASSSDVRAAFERFDDWSDQVAERVELLSTDIRIAEALIRQLNHPLKAPDATHIVIARRIGASLATFDETMAREASRLGVLSVQF